jgi:Fe-S cluster assembly ATP-binding protein
MTNFLKESVNSVREARGEEPLSAADFLKMVREKAKLVDLSADLTRRSVNEGFSGGEKKRNEIFQLAMLEPKLAILDETDSGLDIDALRQVSEGVNKLRGDARGFLVITHYQRLLDYIVPDTVHVMVDGRVVRSGDKDLALQLEEKGYEWIREEAAAAA